MKNELGDWTRRFFLCLSFSSSAGGFSRSMSFWSTCKQTKNALISGLGAMGGRGRGGVRAKRSGSRTMAAGRGLLAGAEDDPWRRRRRRRGAESGEGLGLGWDVIYSRDVRSPAPSDRIGFRFWMGCDEISCWAVGVGSGGPNTMVRLLVGPSLKFFFCSVEKVHVDFLGYGLWPMGRV
uniref:Uncharacterized protein n=1 Tax=Oryza brachyantha TaxID=4533 RepID=J3LXF0_ORYBR